MRSELRATVAKLEALGTDWRPNARAERETLTAYKGRLEAKLAELNSLSSVKSPATTGSATQVSAARPASPEQVALAQRCAPRLWLNSREPFPLEGAIVVMHPDQPLIGYHMVWSEDYGHPTDAEPTDHEVIWVQHDGEKPTKMWTYFHHQVYSDDLANNPDRDVVVQFGYHGSAPPGERGLGRTLVNGVMFLMGKNPLLDVKHGEDSPHATFQGSYKDYASHDKLLEFPVRADQAFVSADPNPIVGEEMSRIRGTPTAVSNKRPWP